MKKLLTATLVSLFAVASLACAAEDMTLEITGPDAMRTTGAKFVGTVTGAAPLFGQVDFFWYIDANGDEWPQTAEQIETNTIGVDLDGLSVYHLDWVPDESLTTGIPKDVVLSLYVQVWNPGSSESVVLRDSATIRIVE